MALYRKYRPASFQEVVGQEQVTRPLSVALDSGRINHAYLFSGPRGCGKTSSARILARSLNCVQGPTSTPCGQCHSCVALAPNGPGTVDVIELDAASNNGVEDMRELRDRAVYAPAESRYRIFIIDEAHMISNSGANALLKTVEEPPEHLIFIFATTEPEKVIGTIRSRTHHYPFRLLTPQAMQGLLERTMQAEQVPVDPAVYPLVIRAGGGSPRDTLSVLDQLLSGSGEEGLTYDLARLLLGVTDESLLDAVVNDLATQDKAHLFHVLDDVIESGTDPRRFATDLLDRFRDLLIIRTVPDAFESGLVAAPTERQEGLVEQANGLEPRALTELASTVQDGLLELRGATSPRLLLEILSAKLLLIMDKQQESAIPMRARRKPNAPSAQATAPAAQAAPQQAPAQSAPQQAPAQPAPAATPPVSSQPTAPVQPAPVQQTPVPENPVQQAPAQQTAAQQAPVQSAEATQPQQSAPQQSAPQQEQSQAAPAAPQETPAPQQSSAPAAVAGSDELQTKWNQVLKHYARTDRVGWVMLMQAPLLAVQDNTVYLGHTTGALKARLEDPSHIEPLEAAIAEVTGNKYSVRFVVGTDPKVLGAELAHQASTSSQPAPAVAEAPQQPASQTEQDPSPVAESQQQQQSAPDLQAAQSAPEASTPIANDGWGAPAPIGGGVTSAGTNNAENAESSESAPAAASTPTPTETASQQPAAVEAPAQVSSFGQDPETPNATGGAGSTNEAAAEDTPAKPKKSSLQERVERSRQLAARHREEMAKHQFSDGTPLPPEPEPEPPAPNDYYPQDPGPRGGFGAAASAQNTSVQDSSAPATGLQAGSSPESQAEAQATSTDSPAAPQQAGPTASVSSPASATQSATGASESSNSQPSAAQTPEDQEAEIIHEASYGSGERDHRNPLDVAVDLVTGELGGRRV